MGFYYTGDNNTHFPGLMLRLKTYKSTRAGTQIRTIHAISQSCCQKYSPKAGHLLWSKRSVWHTLAACSGSGPLNHSFPEGEFSAYEECHWSTQVCSVSPYIDTQRGNAEGSISMPQVAVGAITLQAGLGYDTTVTQDTLWVSRGNDLQLQLMRWSWTCDLEMKGSDAVNYLVFFIFLLHI